MPGLVPLGTPPRVLHERRATWSDDDAAKLGGVAKAHTLRRQESTGTGSSLATKKLPRRRGAERRNHYQTFLIGRQRAIDDHGVTIASLIIQLLYA
jgi:hypothetical protein